MTGVLFDARYLLGPVLGRGGMADVYRADDLVTGRSVAVKILRTQRPDDLRRFAVEAEILGRLDHPALVRLLDAGDQDGLPYLVLELVRGRSLARKLDQAALPVDVVAELGAALADGLAHAHAMGVTHRDVKPGNVLIDDDGRPHLTDFGIARLVGGDALTATGEVLGTACYLGPEQLQGREITPAVDVYSLGLILVEALSGSRPFDGTGSEAAVARLHRDPVVPPQAPAWMAQALTAMTARDPSRRPAAAMVATVFTQRSAAALGDVTLRNNAADPPTEVLGIRPTPPPTAHWFPRWLVAGIAGIALIAVVLLGILYGNDDGSSPLTVDTTTTAVVTTAPPTTAAPPAAPPTTERHGKKKGKDGDD